MPNSKADKQNTQSRKPRHVTPSPSASTVHAAKPALLFLEFRDFKNKGGIPLEGKSMQQSRGENRLRKGRNALARSCLFGFPLSPCHFSGGVLFVTLGHLSSQIDAKKSKTAEDLMLKRMQLHPLNSSDVTIPVGEILAVKRTHV